MTAELEYKYEVKVERRDKPIRFDASTKEALREAGMMNNNKLKITGVSPKMLKTMKSEYVECPVLQDQVHFVQCFVCPNFQSRLNRMVLCRGSPIAGAPAPKPAPEARADGTGAKPAADTPEAQGPSDQPVHVLMRPSHGDAAPSGDEPVSEPVDESVEVPAAESDAAKPDAAKPDAAKPDAAKPDAAKPDAAKPDAAKPDTPEPNMAKPDAAKPDAAKPDTPEPNMAKPDAAKPKQPKDAAESAAGKKGGRRPDAGRRQPAKEDVGITEPSPATLASGIRRWSSRPSWPIMLP